MEIDALRLVPLTGPCNFRDLGGYRALPGMRVKIGRVFRSDALEGVTVDDLERLRSMGLATILDLRSPSEAARDGRGLLVDEPVRYHNLPVIPDTGVPDDLDSIGLVRGDMASRYVAFLEVGASSIVSAMEVIADDGNHPLVFHCAAGKDRTGIVAAFLLSVLGVPDDLVVEDYAITQSRMPFIVERLRRHPVYGSSIDRASSERLSARPETMQRFLALMRERHGRLDDFLVASGLASEALDAMREALLEPVPN